MLIPPKPEHLTGEGYALLDPLLSETDIRESLDALAHIPRARAGTRKLLEQPWCAALGERLILDCRLGALLPQEARVVQCTLFEKSSACNWLVPLHQDVSIPVAEQVDSPQCSGWSVKEGVLHVQPPVAVLESLLAVRVHLDDCDESNGALRVVPGSHCAGRLSPGEVLRLREERGEQAVPAARGGALLMRPLLLHSSSRATGTRPRRVLHFLIGPAVLPEGLRWPALRGDG